jgi:hypothetical protein
VSGFLLPAPLQPTYLTEFKTEGADLKGIFYLRNVVDADKIIEALPAAKAKGGKARARMQTLPPASPCVIVVASCHWSPLQCLHAMSEPFTFATLCPGVRVAISSALQRLHAVREYAVMLRCRRQ